jgi:hypothetical protein
MAITQAALKVAKMSATELVKVLQVLGYGMRLLRINTVKHDIYYSKIIGTNGRMTPKGIFIICLDDDDLMVLDRSRSMGQDFFDPYCTAQMDRYDCVYHNISSSSTSALRLHNAVHLVKRTGSPAVRTIRMNKPPVALTIWAFSPTICGSSPNIYTDDIFEDGIYLKLLEICTSLEPSIDSTVVKLKKEAKAIRKSFTRMRLNPLQISSHTKPPMVKRSVSFEDPVGDVNNIWGLRQYPLTPIKV